MSESGAHFEIDDPVRIADVAQVEDGQAERDGDDADHEQRPDVPPDVRYGRAVEDRVPDPAQRIGGG